MLFTKVFDQMSIRALKIGASRLCIQQNWSNKANFMIQKHVHVFLFSVSYRNVLLNDFENATNAHSKKAKYT